MQFFLVLALLMALYLADSPGIQGIGGADGFRTVLTERGVAGAVLLSILSAVMVAGLIVRGMRRDRVRVDTWIYRAQRVQLVHAAASVASMGAVVFWLRWPQLVKQVWRWEGFILVDELLILIPLVSPVVFSWAAFFFVERAYCQLVGVPVGPWMREWVRHLILRFRQDLGLLLFPVLAMLALQDAGQRWAPEFLDGPLGGIAYGLPLLGLLALFPWMVRRIWPNLPLSQGTLREELTELVASSGLKVREILIWQTDRRLINAAVVGFWPGLRYVFLSDGLLSCFPQPEVSAVFAHEIAHLQRHHLWLRLAAVAAPLGAWSLCGQLLGGSAQPTPTVISAAALLPTSWPWWVPLIAAGSALVIVTKYCRLLEHQADISACRLLSATRDAEGRLVGMELATRRMIAALERLASCGQPRNRRTWLHPSIQQRVELLERLTGNFEALADFDRRLRWLNCLLIGLAAALFPALLIGG